MDFNKKRCKKLKEIRKSIADKLGIDLQQKECTFEGKCSGTCPKCKQEEEILNKALLKRAGAIGIATTMSMGLVGCNFLNSNNGELTGDVEVVNPPISISKTTINSSGFEITTGIVANDFNSNVKSTTQEEILEGEVLDDPNILGGLEYKGEEEINSIELMGDIAIDENELEEELINEGDKD